MVLVLEEKFLERRWWKYGAALAATQLTLWVMLAYRLSAEVDLWYIFTSSYVVYGVFIICAFMPFTAGRLQLKTFFWATLVGYFLACVAYYTLALSGVGRSLPLLPFIAFVQVNVIAIGIGTVIELGRYVFRKLTE